MIALKRWLLIFILCLLGVRCAFAPPEVENPAQLPQVIFVPGYYGSTLIRVEDAKKIWFTAGQALWGNQTLALDVGGIGIPGATRLRVGDVFRSLGFLGLSKNVYGSIIDGLREGLLGRANVVAFAYDWRQDITQTSRELSVLVDNLYAQGAPKVAVVAHSMGGLVTGYYLLYGDQKLENARLNLAGAQKLQAVAMAATPFQGTLAVFRNMQHGIEFGFNAKALEGLAVASFPSSYQILPQYPKALLSSDGRDLSDWIFDSKRWQDFDWSLLNGAEKLDRATEENRAKYTHAMLAAARKLYEKMHPAAADKMSGLPFLYFLGDSTETVNGALWHEKKRKLLFPGMNLAEAELEKIREASFFLPGDGTVTEPAAEPPKSFAAIFSSLEIQKKPQEHLQLLQDSDNLNAILNFLQDALELPNA